MSASVGLLPHSAVLSSDTEYLTPPLHMCEQSAANHVRARQMSTAGSAPIECNQRCKDRSTCKHNATNGAPMSTGPRMVTSPSRDTSTLCEYSGWGNLKGAQNGYAATHRRSRPSEKAERHKGQTKKGPDES